ncbi:MAG: 3,4-dihydroxy-2-butanone-4-phosphate synthase [Phycisphaerae bacterium]|nr:3,4-dihydroxy-2-butanone-4-phosphate synthase [Phycisphaerae bacterium]
MTSSSAVASYTPRPMPLSPISEILEDLRAGRVVVLVDDEHRENEGDFVVAAEKVTPEVVNFLTRVGGGYLCVSLAGEICDRLQLVPQAAVNTSVRATPFTVSVDGHPRHGVGTGISARDRATTIRMLLDPAMKPDDFVRPGHINPLRAREGGVLVRTGQTEGSVDLCRLAGLEPAAAIIEIVRPDGEMARMPDLERLCAEHGIRMCSVEQVIEHRLARENLVRRIAPAEGVDLETPQGRFRLVAFESEIDALPHLALTMGGIGVPGADGRVPVAEDEVLVRMHRRDLLGDIFGVASPGGVRSSETLARSLAAIARAGRGALVYLRSEAGTHELASRLQRIRRAGEDPDRPDLTSVESVAGRAMPMDQREFGIGGQILRDLGLRRLRLLTNHPGRPRPGLHGFGLEIVGEVPVG